MLMADEESAKLAYGRCRPKQSHDEQQKNGHNCDCQPTAEVHQQYTRASAVRSTPLTKLL
jgi:hypothetical protein